MFKNGSDYDQKLPAWNKGKQLSPEIRANMSAANKGKIISPEHRASISATLTGRTRSEETRAKIAVGNTGKTLSAETRAKISAGNAGKTMSAAAIKNRNESMMANTAKRFYGKHPLDWAELLGNHESTVKSWKKKGILLQKLQERGYCLEETA